jgi:hypothetical protein
MNELSSTGSSHHAKKPIWPLLLLLFGVPLALLLAKWSGLTAGTFLAEHVSLASLPTRLQDKLARILFVPLGAMLVVLVRLTLGLRVLGPFRSILLAVTFQITGVVLGMIFLATTIAIVVGIRPSIRSLGLPYFGRITVILSTVAMLMTLGVMAGDWLHLAVLQTIAYFPIVVLCLVADAFARTMNTEGLRSALWRGSMTAVVAVALGALANAPMLADLLRHYPELLIAQIGGIILISRWMAWRLLERFNPKTGEDEEDVYEKEEVPFWKNQLTLAVNLSPQHQGYTERYANAPVNNLETTVSAWKCSPSPPTPLPG